MQVCNLAEYPVSARAVAQINGSQCSYQEDGKRCRGEHPSQAERRLPLRGHAFLYALTELRAGSEAFSCGLDCALHLDAGKSIRRAGRAASHVHIEGAHLLLWNFTVDVGVEFCLPRLTNHGSSPLQLALKRAVEATLAADGRVTSSAHATNATLPCRSGWRAFRRFPDMTSPPRHIEG